MDRSGYARGTLAPRAGMAGADVRALDAAADSGDERHGNERTRGVDHAAWTITMRNRCNMHADRVGRCVDMRATCRARISTIPGPGLRDNGRRVLTYADLHTLGGPIDQRDAAAATIELHLTGHMERFIWSFDGQKFSEAQPLRVHARRTPAHRAGERHDDDAPDPSARHVERSRGRVTARSWCASTRSTLQPGQQLRYAVTADALGRWAYHCHLLYHMEAGMFREVHVA